MFGTILQKVDAYMWSESILFMYVEVYTNEPHQHYIGCNSEAEFNKETERKQRSVALAAKFNM
jgi:hypothetical protein